MLSTTDLLKLTRWNTPTIYNGWEQITQRDPAADGINLEPVNDFMPEMGPMAGYAATLVIEPSNPKHAEDGAAQWRRYREYLASLPGPTIVVVQDLDQPNIVGSSWGEVNASVCRALGCVGTITDGAVRDLDEMRAAGLKAIARRLCVGHAHACPVRWNCEVRAFGQTVQPGQLIHADKHGFLAIEPEVESRLLEAAIFMDNNECQTVIPAAKDSHDVSRDEIVQRVAAAGDAFGKAAREKFGKGGEWD